MLKYFLLVLIVFFSLSILIAEGWAIQTTSDEFSDRMRARIQALRLKNHFICQRELVCGVSVIPIFYGKREFNPAWCGKDGVSSQADDLLTMIQGSDREGLIPSDYHLMRLKALITKVRQKQSNNQPLDIELLVDLDLLLTDAFLLLASHLLAGRVNPETIHTEWMVVNPKIDLAAALESALNTNSVSAVLEVLRPPQAGYQALRDKLQRYRYIAKEGGWPVLPTKTSWRKDDHGARFYLLRKRLELSGDLDPTKPGYVYMFDEVLEIAIRKFKARHGLNPDGIIDARTLAALNVPVEERVRQIELNLERWRWIPHELGQRYIMVNIADFKLNVVEDRQTVMESRVVVGKDYRKTPVFSKNMTHLVLNPYWNIPTKIAVEDILPKVKRNPRYLIRRNIKVFESWEEGAPELDPLSIDWSKVDENNFSFKFRREPGPRNDLGRIKFMLPNKFAVYLHDTPYRGLFRKPSRVFSSGCIRVEKSTDLAVYLIRDDPQLSRQDILETLKTTERQVIRLQNPIPVHLLYWTAWVGQDGLLHFREDVYERDKPLDVALRERPPKV
ncbi:MAG: L,D-transpeptidase family protein [Deltaproteobacteria bacterium]|nr:MAG: L,D-transpeptidase family protein [Deltaproteobacteria bacterium]